MCVCVSVCLWVRACMHVCVCAVELYLLLFSQMSYGSSLTKLSLLDLNKPVSLPLAPRGYVYIMLKFAIIE